MLTPIHHLTETRPKACKQVTALVSPALFERGLYAVAAIAVREQSAGPAVAKPHRAPADIPPAYGSAR